MVHNFNYEPRLNSWMRYILLLNIVILNEMLLNIVLIQ